MSNKVLKTTLLSLTAASLLTTSAYANFTIGTTLSGLGDALTKEAGQLNVHKFDFTSNYTFKVTTLDVVIGKDENATNTSFLTNVVLFKDGLNATYKIASKPIPSIESIDNNVTVSFTTNDIDVARNEFDGKKNNLYVALEYGNIAETKEGNVIVWLKNLAGLEVKDTTDTTAPEVGEGNLSVETIEKTKASFLVDQTAPYITEINASVYKQANSTITFTFSEDMRKVSDNGSFSLVDGKGDAVAIDGAKLVSTPGNFGELTVSQEDVNNSASGDLTLKYSGTVLKDIFGNELNISRDFNKTLYVDAVKKYKIDNNTTEGNIIEDLSVGVKVFDDNTAPTIETVALDFDDAKKGYIIFSEEVKTPAVGWNTKVFYGAENNDSTSASKYKVTFGTPTLSENKTKISFDLNETVANDFALRFLDTNSSTRIGDYGENNMSINERNMFTPKTISFGILPGWNLVSLDSQTRTTSKRVLETGSVEMIWGYDSTNGKWNRFPNDIIAGKGYWIKGNKLATDFNGSVKIADKNDEKAEKYVVDNNLVIKNADAKNKWALVGVNENNLTWSEAYSQVADNCYGVAIYDYNTSVQQWNVDKNISGNSGIWVKQDCDDSYNNEQ
jgi:hypothetical protein